MDPDCLVECPVLSCAVGNFDNIGELGFHLLKYRKAKKCNIGVDNKICGHPVNQAAEFSTHLEVAHGLPVLTKADGVPSGSINYCDPCHLRLLGHAELDDHRVGHLDEALDLIEHDPCTLGYDGPTKEDEAAQPHLYCPFCLVNEDLALHDEPPHSRSGVPKSFT